MKRVRQITSLLGWVLALCVVSRATPTLACPDVNGLLDWNCDGAVVVTTFGDSITYGVGDSRYRGYPGRLKRLAPNIQLHSMGSPGEKTPIGRNRARNSFRRARTSDFVIILEGVNDFWLPMRSVSATRLNLLGMKESARLIGAISLLGRLTPTLRELQKPWVSQLNSALARSAEIDFYSIGESSIGADRLHPTGLGYQKMATIAYQKLRSVTKQRRPRDQDADGIYDFAEHRFGSDPRIADTDGDGVRDGLEVFQYRSRPDVVDSDGDGLSDGYEINLLGSNPSNSLPGSPTLLSIRIVE